MVIDLINQICRAGGSVTIEPLNGDYLVIGAWGEGETLERNGVRIGDLSSLADALATILMWREARVKQAA